MLRCDGFEGNICVVSMWEILTVHGTCVYYTSSFVLFWCRFSKTLLESFTMFWELLQPLKIMWKWSVFGYMYIQHCIILHTVHLLLNDGADSML